MSTASQQRRTTAWLFPGQGSQHQGMGADFVDLFSHISAEWDALVDFDFWAACNSASGYLDRTDRLQPTLYTVNYLHALHQLRTSDSPDMLAGHSLGEISALAVAGTLSYGDGLRFVVARGKLMHQATKGGMAAALRISTVQLQEVLRTGSHDTVDVANFNSPTETVLSGPVGDLNALAPHVRASGGVLIPLKVSAPFHSRYMAPAAERLAVEASRLSFDTGSIPVISNVDSSTYTAQRAAHLLVAQVHQPVQWSKSMQELHRRKVTSIIETGPGTVLTKLWGSNPLQPQKHASELEPSPSQVAGAHLDQIKPAKQSSYSGTGARPASPVRLPDPTDRGVERVGSPAFCDEYRTKHAYVAGSMYRGISSVALVERMSRAGYLSFFGSGGLSEREIEDQFARLARTCSNQPWGVNLLHQPDKPETEAISTDAALRHGVRTAEASAFTSLTEHLVRYRFTGARFTGPDARVPNRLIAKVSRSEVARKFLLPPPRELLESLTSKGLLTAEEATVAARTPMATDVCVEADSGGHTDKGSALALVPAIRQLAVETASLHRLPCVRIGAAGGVGSPQAVRALLALGADFILTGSINQCTPEAATSDSVKDMLETLGVHDTAMAPASDLFEVDGRIQVVRKGTLFAARANKLQRIYREHKSWNEVPLSVRATIETQILRATYADEVEHLLRRYAGDPVATERVASDPRAQMAAVFKRYLVRTTTAATEGRVAESTDYQIHCGPAMGAFNTWVRGTRLQNWKNRHIDLIADALLEGLPTDPSEALAAQRLSPADTVLV